MDGRARVLLGFGAFGAFWGAWGALLPVLQRHAHVSDGELGVALVFIGVGALLSLRPMGALADRHPRVALPVGLALLGLSTIGPAIARGALALSVASLLVGVCSGAADAAMNAAGAAYEARGGRALSLGHGMFSALVVVASLASAALLLNATAPWPLMVAGAALLTAGALSAALPVATVADAAPAPAGRWFSRRPPSALVLLGSLGAVAYLIENAWQSWAAMQLHTTLGTSPAVAAVGPAVFAGSAAAGRFTGHPLQRRATAKALVGCGAATAAAGSIVAALAPSVPIAIAGIALAGLGTSVCAPTLIGLAGRVTPHRPGAATSTVITLSYLGFVLSPAAVGLVAQATTLRIALTAIAVAAASLALASRTLTRITRAPSASVR
jgi:MFS family permease